MSLASSGPASRYISWRSSQDWITVASRLKASTQGVCFPVHLPLLHVADGDSASGSNVGGALESMIGKVFADSLGEMLAEIELIGIAADEKERLAAHSREVAAELARLAEGRNAAWDGDPTLSRDAQTGVGNPRERAEISAGKARLTGNVC